MEFTADRNALAEAAINVSQGIPSNPLQPVYAGMLIQTTGDTVLLTGSDGYVTFQGWVDIDNYSDGAAIVPGKLFADVLRSLSGDNVGITSDTGNLHIQCGRANFTIRTQPAKDYPNVPQAGPPLGTIDGELFTTAVKKIVPSTAKSDANPAITGILLEPADGGLTMVATDRYRAAITTLPWKGEADQRCVLPGWAAERFTRAVDGDVSLGWDADLCSLQSGSTAVITRTIGGEFPKWRQLLPQTPPDIEVAVEDLAAAVKRAQLAVFSDATPVELTFTTGRLYVEAGEEGSASKDVVECDYDGDDFHILLGISKLLDGLSGCEKTVRFGLTEPLKPLYLQSGSLTYTILPRRRT